MGWEFRFFVRTAQECIGVIPLEGEREDVYFPACEVAGVKLRNGQGGLEVKLRTELSAADGKLVSPAERWTKSIHNGCIVGTTREPELNVEALSRAIRRPAAEMFTGEPLPMRVFCRKLRRQTCQGGVTVEYADCVFIAKLSGCSRPVLVERYQSTSIEGASVGKIAAAVSRLGIPPNAVVGGYPSIVLDIARRAMKTVRKRDFSVSARGDVGLDEQLSSENAPSSNVAVSDVLKWYKVLKSGDVRTMPRSDASSVGRLAKGGVLNSIQEETDTNGRVWVRVCKPPCSEHLGWTAMTKKSGEAKLLARPG